MSFGFGNSTNTMSGGAAGVNAGPDLETIQTEALGFLSIAGDAKVRLTSSWESLPTATSSLLSIASRKGLVAAAGPNQIVIATTETIRKAFEAPKDGESDIRDFEPQLKIPMSMRVSQLAFTADENYLVLSAESGGGLAVYEVQNLLQGSSNSAFELSTNGEALRALIPNPTAEKAELCAIVTDGGNLHMANLQERKISNVLKNQVSCISWSSKGKQLCAGLADGTIHQMTPEGEGKADIPRPPSVDNSHVSSLLWLENNLFLAIYSTAESPPSSTYQLITRQSPSSFNFQKLTDPVEPFGSDKVPHHTLLRLRDFPPDLQDLLIVSSTASTDVGLLTRSKSPLANDKPADSITGVFTTTELLDDSKRPTLPMTDSMDDSTPIGVGLDLSSKTKVYKPIPSDEELEESPSPLPGFWVLTHEGVLCSWWVIYTDSIKKGTAYPGLSVAQGSALDVPPASTTPSASPFVAASTSSAFASSTTAAPAFGSSSLLGQKSSPWAAAGSTSSPSNTGGAAFGSNAFGTSSSPGAAFGQSSTIGFGQSSQLGMKASPWASSGGSTSSPAFGQSGFASFANKDFQSPFGASTSTPSAAPASGGFAGFASKGGFASLGGNTSGASIFGNGGKLGGSVFGSTSADTAFPPKQDKPSASVFGSAQDKLSGGLFGSSPFKLQSSFKPDPSAKEDNVKTPTAAGSMFGSAFGSALGDAGNKPAPSAKDEDMDTMEATEAPQSQTKTPFSPRQTLESTTPTTTPAPTRFGAMTSTTPATSVFGQPSKPATSTLFGFSSDTPKPSGGTGLFGSLGSTPKATSSTGMFGSLGDTPKSAGQKIVESETPASKFGTPPPSETTSKTTFSIGDSSGSSAVSTAPGLFGASTTTPKADTTSFLSGLGGAKSSAGAAISSDAPRESSGFVKVSKPLEQPTVIEDAPLPPDYLKISKPVSKVPDVPLPPDPVKSLFSKPSNAAAPSSFILPKAPSKLPSDIPPAPGLTSGDETESGLEDNASEGSGVDVGKDLSPTISGLTPTPSFTPQSSFGGLGGPVAAVARPGPEPDRSRPAFGELGRNAPVIPPPITASPRSPSPVREAIPSRVLRPDATRSVSAPGMASQLLGPKKSHLGTSVVSREKPTSAEDPFLAQHRKLKERQEAEEVQLLIDEEDDEVQRVLTSEIEGTLELDEFIAHSNVAPPAKESIPAQVEAVYRDINSMIDTLGLNARAVKSFTQGHTENGVPDGRTKEDLEDSDDWVLCEISDLGEILDNDLHADLDDGRVQDLSDKLDACQDLARDMHRLRAKQEDLRRVIMSRMDPGQADIARSLPLSAEQAAQQNELRRDFTNFTKVLTEAEEALILLKAKIASISSASGKGTTNVPTVEAVMRTITKMTSMVEKRSGDIDVLETQLRKIRLDSDNGEGSPFTTPKARRSVLLSPDSTPSRNIRHSLASSVMSLGASVRATTPRKKLSGFSREEKGDLMDKRAKRQAVLAKLKESVVQKGVSVWNMEDIE